MKTLKSKSTKREALPRPAVTFARMMLEAGVPLGLFESFVFDAPTSHLDFALALAALSRIHPSSGGDEWRFVPIALGWFLEQMPSAHHSLYCDSQYNANGREIPGDAHYSTQKQSALPSARVAVVEVKYPDSGLKLLQEICRFRFDPERGNHLEYLKNERIGLGLAHAKKVADSVLIQPRSGVSKFARVIGPESEGRSLFLLLDRVSFQKTMDDKTGTPDMGWLEVRVISSDLQRRERILFDFHQNLEHPIPSGSLMAVANIPWFKEPS